MSSEKAAIPTTIKADAGVPNASGNKRICGAKINKSTPITIVPKQNAIHDSSNEIVTPQRATPPIIHNNPTINLIKPL